MVCNASKSSFSAGLKVLIMKAIFWTSYREIFTYPITTQTMAILQNPVRRLQMIIFSWSYGACHQSGNLQLLRWNAYLTKFIPKGWLICKIIVFSWPCSAYHQSDILEILRRNSHLTSLRIKGWPVFKLPSHAFESSFFRYCYDASHTATFWSSLCKSSHLTPLRSKSCPIWKILRDTSKSSFSASFYGAYL